MVIGTGKFYATFMHDTEIPTVYFSLQLAYAKSSSHIRYTQTTFMGHGSSQIILYVLLFSDTPPHPLYKHIVLIFKKTHTKKMFL